jgi:hypothetical protein
MSRVVAFLHKIHRPISILSLCVLYFWNVSGKTKRMYQILRTTSAVMDAMADFLAAAICIINTFAVSDLELQSIWKSLEKIDKFLDIKSDTSFVTTLHKFRHVIIATHCMTVVTFGWDVSSRSQAFGWDVYQYNIVVLIFLYKFLLMVLQIYLLSRSLDKRFTHLHQKFVSLTNHTDQNFVLSETVNCMKCHYSLGEIMEKLGQLYGWQMFLTEKMLVLYLSETVYFLYLLTSTGLVFHLVQVIGYALWTTFMLVILVFPWYKPDCNHAGVRIDARVFLRQDQHRRKTECPALLQFDSGKRVVNGEKDVEAVCTPSGSGGPENLLSGMDTG